jgi:hypothetical protein
MVAATMATFQNTVTIRRPSRLLAPLAASRVKTAVAANLRTLKQLLETGVGVTHGDAGDLKEQT